MTQCCPNFILCSSLRCRKVEAAFSDGAITGNGGIPLLAKVGRQLGLTHAVRSRWKVENKTFNTLKNVQYPGTQLRTREPSTLSDTFAALMLLAFLINQVLHPHRDVGTSAQQFLCGALRNKTGSNCKATPSGSTPCKSPTIRPDGRPPPELDQIHHWDGTRGLMLP